MSTKAVVSTKTVLWVEMEVMAAVRGWTWKWTWKGNEKGKWKGKWKREMAMEGAMESESGRSEVESGSGKWKWKWKVKVVGWDVWIYCTGMCGSGRGVAEGGGIFN